MKKLIAILLTLVLTGCGFKVVQNSSFNNFSISDIITEGDKRINDFPQSRQFLHSKTKDTNFAETWMQESHSRRLESEFFTINIEVFGDTNVMCGDIIEIIIPMNRPLGAADTDSFADPILSGRYLVIALAHQINHPNSRLICHQLTVKAQRYRQWYQSHLLDCN